MSKLIFMKASKKSVPKKKARPAAAKKNTGRRAENKERTKRNILKAALALFRKRGFYETTTKEISTKAKIAEGTLFNYFRTKEDLALYFFENEMDSLIEWFENEDRLCEAPLAERLFAVIYHHLEQIGPYEDFIGAVYLRALQPVSKLNPLSLDSQHLNLRYLRFIKEIFALAEEREEIPPVGDLGAYAFGIFHMAMISYWLHDHSDGKENTLALLDLALHAAERIAKTQEVWEW